MSEAVEVIRLRGDEVFVDGTIAGGSYVVAPGAELVDGQAVALSTDEQSAARGGERPRAARTEESGDGPEPRGAGTPVADQGEG